MDYPAHERTFATFIAFSKIGILATLNIVIALTLFAFGRGGFWLGVLLILILSVATAIGLASKGSTKALLVSTVIAVIFFVLSVA